MFKCKQCSKNSNSGEKQVKRVTETRFVKYKNGGEGWEIVKEVGVCKICVDKEPISLAQVG